MTAQTSFASRLQQQNNALKVGIIGAMDEEVEILKQALQNREDHTIAGYELFTGQMHGVEVVLLKSGIGKVNAAIGTTLMLQTFQPTCVINTGSAGGFAAELEVGDVVISSEVRHHDVDVTIFGYEHGQVPGLPAAADAWDLKGVLTQSWRLPIAMGIRRLPGPAVAAHVGEGALGAPTQALSGQRGISDGDRRIAGAAVDDLIGH